MRLVRDIVPNIDEIPTRQRSSFPEIEDELFWEYYDSCKEYSMVHVTGFYNIYQTFNYIAKNGIRGNAVECGCFLGGIAQFMGLLRKRLGLSHMEILLFDTFEGQPVGSTDMVFGKLVESPYLLPNYRELVPERIKEVVGSLDGYRFIEGCVENTLPNTATGDLAVLRLDTDFYSSTKIELDVLYPRLVKGGAIIIDDYGLFQGARRATDEYFGSIARPPLLNRIDIGIWAGVKPHQPLFQRSLERLKKMKSKKIPIHANTIIRGPLRG